MAKTKQKQELTIEEKLSNALVPESEQPYKLPENWCWVRLGKILYLVQDKFNPQEERSNNLKISPFLKGNGCVSRQGDFNKEEKISLSAKADIPLYERGYIDNPIEADFKIKYIGLEHIEKDNGITDYGYVDEVKSPKNVFKKGDLLYGKLRPYLNKHDVAYFDGVCSTDILVYRSIEPTTTKFANYLFSTSGFIQYAIENSHGINLPRISSNDIANFYFPLPPLAEQQRIVDLIERLFAKLDEAKEKVLAALDSFELRKASILHKAFSGNLTDKYRKKNKLDLSQWSKNKLENCGDWCGGGTPSMKVKEYWENGKILWITSKDMKSDYISDSLMHITMLGVKNSSANYINTPSLLFVTRSGILRRTLPISMVQIPFTVNQDLKVLTPKNIELKYIFYACKCFEKQILITCMKNGTTVESINTNALLNFEIPIAPLSEQKEIVRILDTLLEKSDRAKELAENALENIDTLKKTILAKAFRGLFGTNRPDEASSMELLKQSL